MSKINPRVLPHSTDAEKAVLCSVLLDPSTAMGRCKEKGFNDRFFHIPANALIFRVMMKLYLAGKPIEIVFLTQHLIDSNSIESAGGPAYVTELLSFVPTASNVDHYIDIVRDKATLRRAIIGCTEVIELCHNEQGDIEAISEAAQKALLSVIESSEGREPVKTTAQHVAELMNRLDEARELSEQTGEKNMRGLPSGLQGFDDLTGGLQDTAYIALAGQKTQGKTALGLGMASTVAIDQGLPTAIFSFEMKTAMLIERLVSERSGVNLFHIVNGNLSLDDQRRIAEAAPLIARAPIYIEDQPGMTIMELCAKARRLKADKGIKLIVVDYIQLVKGLGRRKEESKTDEATDCSRILKQLQKELGIPIIVLAQAGDNGKVKWAEAIGEDADILIFIEHHHGGSYLKLAKNRGGEKDLLIPVKFEKEFVRFRDRYEEEQQEQERPRKSKKR